MNRFLLFLVAFNLVLTGWFAFRPDYQQPPQIYFPEIDFDSEVSYTYRAELVRVIDGDTVVLNVDLGFEHWLHNQTFRLYGIDAPETRTTDLDEKRRGLQAKEWLECRSTDNLSFSSRSKTRKDHSVAGSEFSSSMAPTSMSSWFPRGLLPAPLNKAATLIFLDFLSCPGIRV